jgi:hypothetical protein
MSYMQRITPRLVLGFDFNHLVFIINNIFSLNNHSTYMDMQLNIHIIGIISSSSILHRKDQQT